MKTPRVQLPRRLWIPGIEYAGETAAQASAREARFRADDAEIDRLERAAEADRARPMPHLEAWAIQRGLWKPEA